MPKEIISTYATVFGNVKVEKIFGEEIVRNVSKEVGVFEKYTTKKSINVRCKQSTDLTR